MGKSSRTKKKKVPLQKKRDFLSLLPIHKKRIVLGILLFHFILALLFFDLKLYTGGDNATYSILAKSILTGEGFRDLHKPGSPPHTLVSFGYPLLLAPIMFFSKGSYIPLKLLSLAFSVGILLIFYHILKRRFPLPLVLGILFLLSLHPLLLEYSRWILTEVPFLFFSFLALLLYQKSEEKGKGGGPPFILASIFVVMTYFIRSIGISFVLSSFAYLAFKKNWKRLFISILITVCLILPWWIRTQSVRGEKGGYLSQFLSVNPYDIHSGHITLTQLFQRIGENLKIYLTQGIPDILFPSISWFKMQKEPLWILSLLFLGIILYGLFRNLREKLQIEHIYIFFYGGILLLWPSVWSTTRFLTPIFPFLILYALWGGVNILSRTSKERKYGFLSLILIIPLLISALAATIPKIPDTIANTRYYLAGDKFSGYTQDWIRYFESAKWIKENTPEDALILCRKPALYYLHSERKSLVYPMTSNRGEVYSFILNQNVDYIIVDSFFWTGTTSRYLIPVLQEHGKDFEIVFVTQDPKTFILKVHPSRK
jgi:hypothetical protein